MSSEMTLSEAVEHLDRCSYADGDDVCGRAIQTVRDHARVTLLDTPAGDGTSAVEPPELWWSASLAAERGDPQDGVLTEDRGALYRQRNAEWKSIAELPVDAVRLATASGCESAGERS